MQKVNFDNGCDNLGNYPIITEHDIVKVRQLVRHYVKQIRMGLVEQTRITTAVSELFRNMFNYAGGGEVIIEQGLINGRTTLVVTCVDNGPGIENLELAMSDGFTSEMGMGYGLPGAKRLVDNFEIESQPGKGTTVRVMKWK